MKKIIIALLLAAVLLPLAAENPDKVDITLTQVDASRLLNFQQADLYLNVTDENGGAVEGLTRKDFLVDESVEEGSSWQEARILAVDEAVNAEEGIAFHLLIDNSGSMYNTLEGGETDDPEETRIASAKRVLRTFLGQIDHPRDTAGLVAFNTWYEVQASPGSRPEGLADRLNFIEQPEGDAGWTELYTSLNLAAEDLASLTGRRAVILLSDGENRSYLKQTGKDHPVWGKEESDADQVIETYRKAGLTIYAVGLGAAKDPNLARIAESTGGRLFDARTEEDLSRIYNAIRDQMLKEYRIRYWPTPSSSREKIVRVSVRGAAGSGERAYYSSSLMGDTSSRLTPWLLLPLLLGLAGLLLVNLRNWQEKVKEARLTVLDNQVGTVINPRVTLGAQTVIGGGPGSDLTIANDPDIGSGSPATIIADEKTGNFTIAGAPAATTAKSKTALTQVSGVTVNHQPAKPGQKLENGDVITVGGATIIFEEPEQKPEG